MKNVEISLSLNINNSPLSDRSGASYTNQLDLIHRLVLFSEQCEPIVQELDRFNRFLLLESCNLI